MKVKQDYVTNSSSTCYLITSVNPEHSSEKMEVTINIAKSASLTEITPEILEVCKKNISYGMGCYGEGYNKITIGEDYFEDIEFKLSRGIKVFHASVYENEQMGFDAKDITVFGQEDC